MKAIMISIQPKWVAKILNGEKTSEIRKTTPKCDLPIDVYIYCTKGNKNECLIPDLQPDKVYHPLTEKLHRGVYSIVEEKAIWNDCKKYILNGKVVARFRCDKVEEIKSNIYTRELYATESLIEDELLEKSCLSYNELDKYLDYPKGKDGYAWHIDELKILDKPLELTFFHKRGTQKKIDELWDRYRNSNPHDHIVDSCIMAEESKILWDNEITRAPQSWCYIEV